MGGAHFPPVTTWDLVEERFCEGLVANSPSCAGGPLGKVSHVPDPQLRRRMPPSTPRLSFRPNILCQSWPSWLAQAKSRPKGSLSLLVTGDAGGLASSASVTSRFTPWLAMTFASLADSAVFASTPRRRPCPCRSCLIKAEARQLGSLASSWPPGALGDRSQVKAAGAGAHVHI